MTPLQDIVHQRRAYRSLDPVPITDELIEDLAATAALAPSCFNNQPWRYIFVYEPAMLEQVKEALSKGNAWAHAASMIIVVYSTKEDDCVIYDREYFLFDTGLATAFLILRATERDLVAHPIAGYSPSKVKQAVGIPADSLVITLVIVGAHASDISPVLSDKQRQAEVQRPPRKPLEDIMCHNQYCHPVAEGTD
jgi:nitroreductase